MNEGWGLHSFELRCANQPNRARAGIGRSRKSAARSRRRPVTGALPSRSARFSASTTRANTCGELRSLRLGGRSKRANSPACRLKTLHGAMASMIEVRCISDDDPLEFNVVVCDGKGESRQHVTMARKTYEQLTAGKHTPERCLEAAFQFLLDREPKEFDPRTLRCDRDLTLLPRI